MIAIGSDHGGYLLKEEIKKHLKEKGMNNVYVYHDMLPATIPYMPKRCAAQFSPANAKREFSSAAPESE